MTVASAAWNTLPLFRGVGDGGLEGDTPIYVISCSINLILFLVHLWTVLSLNIHSAALGI